MPNQNGTGPFGQGPMTGRGAGPCGGGMGRRRGGGRGLGRGFGRFGIFGRRSTISQEEEKEVLIQESQDLENELKAVKERLSEIQNKE